MFYVFHGEDEFSRAEAIAQMRQKMDPVVGELNTTVLAGRELTIKQLRAACDAMPFMGDRRLVVVQDMLSSSSAAGKPKRNKKPAGGEPSEEPANRAPEDGRLTELLEYLPHLPETTRLVLSEAHSLPGGHPLLRLAGETGGFVRQFAVPAGEELEQWIRQRAQGKGVGIDAEAAGLLATYIGGNLRLLDVELEKLATYLGGQGEIGRSEVERLVSSLQEANIFHMVDALGARDGRRALTLLHRLLEEGAAPLYLLTMIVRQFRLLLEARELDARGTPASDMGRQMEVAPFVATKILRQAGNFRPEQLRTIMAQLLEIDVGIKTGQVEGPLALEMFVVRWSKR